MHFIPKLTLFFLDSYKNPTFDFSEHFIFTRTQKEIPEAHQNLKQILYEFKIQPKNQKDILTIKVKTLKEKEGYFSIQNVEIFFNDQIFDQIEDIDHDPENDIFNFHQPKIKIKKDEKNKPNFKIYNDDENENHIIINDGHYDIFSYFKTLWKFFNPYIPFFTFHVLKDNLIDKDEKKKFNFKTNGEIYKTHIKNKAKSEIITFKNNENENINLFHISNHLNDLKFEDHIKHWNKKNQTSLYSNIKIEPSYHEEHKNQLKENEFRLDVRERESQDNIFTLSTRKPKNFHETIKDLKNLENFNKNLFLFLKNTEFEKIIKKSKIF